MESVVLVNSSPNIEIKNQLPSNHKKRDSEPANSMVTRKQQTPGEETKSESGNTRNSMLGSETIIRASPRASAFSRLSANTESITSGVGPAESTAREKIIKLSLPNSSSKPMPSKTKPKSNLTVTTEFTSSGKPQTAESPTKTRHSPRPSSANRSSGTTADITPSLDLESPRKTGSKRPSSVGSANSSNEDSFRKKTKFVIEEILFDAIISDSEPLDMNDIPTDDDLDDLIDEDALMGTEVGQMFGTVTQLDPNGPKKRGRPRKPEVAAPTSKSTSVTRKKKKSELSPVMEKRKPLTAEKQLPRYVQAFEFNRSADADSRVMSSLDEVFDDESLNHDYCDACGLSGDFICCESCPRSFHYACAEPPVDEFEVDKLDHWYCKICLSKKSTASGKKNNKGPFKTLIQDMEKKNPLAFALPGDIKNHFADISATSEGDYTDLRYSKSMQSRYDRDNIADEKGETILCHRCCKSALEAPIIACDFCPLYWHLDCVDPPLVAYPPGNRKWMCPAHAFEIGSRRKVKNPTKIVIANPAARNDGKIEVLVNEDPVFNQIPREDQFHYEFELPEDSIKLSFFQKVEQSERNQAKLQSTRDEAKDWLLGLSHLHQGIGEYLSGKIIVDSSTSADDKKNMDTLVHAALGLEEGKRPSSIIQLKLPNTEQKRSKSPRNQNKSHVSTPNIINSDDPLFRQFMAWKRLMMLQYEHNRDDFEKRPLDYLSATKKKQ